MAFATNFKGAELLCAFHVLGCILSALAKDDYPRKGVERAYRQLCLQYVVDLKPHDMHQEGPR